MTARQNDSDANSREYWQRAISNPKEYGFSENQVQLMNESLTLADPEFWKKVLASPENFGFTAEQAKCLADKSGNTLTKYIDEQNEMTPGERQEAEAGEHIGFYGKEHVQTWLVIGAVAPKEAALLFFGRNPSKFKDQLPFMGDEFDLMLRTFEDVARDGLPRNLRDWLSVARDQNLHGVAIDGWEACIVVFAPAPVVYASDGPAPLTTGDIAHSFAGLHWDESRWKKPLGDKPKWLAGCEVIPGQQGVRERRWNPVLIGAALVQQGHATARNVRAKFQTVDLLSPWLDVWKTYEADNFDSE